MTHKFLIEHNLHLTIHQDRLAPHVNSSFHTGTLLMDLVDFRGKGFRNGLQNGVTETPYYR
jgi:hypothetical protein